MQREELLAAIKNGRMPGQPEFSVPTPGSKKQPDRPDGATAIEQMRRLRGPIKRLAAKEPRPDRPASLLASPQSVMPPQHIPGLPQSDGTLEGTIATMRESIEVMEGPTVDMSAIDQKLAVCKTCDGLRSNGCMYCNTGCSQRWLAWRKRLLKGACPRFTDPNADLSGEQIIPQTNQPQPFSQPIPQPQFEVNGMFLYVHAVSVIEPNQTATGPEVKRRTINLVAPEDLEAITILAKRTIPGCTVSQSQILGSVDGVADGIVTTEIELSPEKAPQQMRRPGPGPMVMGPNGLMPMPNG